MRQDCAASDGHVAGKASKEARDDHIPMPQSVTELARDTRSEGDTDRYACYAETSVAGGTGNGRAPSGYNKRVLEG